MEIIRYELKYCERCGTLKLRPIDSVSTYCRRCQALLARYSFSRGASDTGRAALTPTTGLAMLGRMPLEAVSDRTLGRVQ